MRNRLVASSCLWLVFILSGCGSYSPTSPAASPSPGPNPTPTPTPAAASPYAGTWKFTTTLTALGNVCGSSASDMGNPVGPFTVAITSAATFTLSDPRPGSGTIDSMGNVAFTLAAGTGSCPVGTGTGGCRDVNHCDGTSEQGGDVHKWTLSRQ